MLAIDWIISCKKITPRGKMNLAAASHLKYAKNPTNKGDTLTKSWDASEKQSNFFQKILKVAIFWLLMTAISKRNRHNFQDLMQSMMVLAISLHSKNGGHTLRGQIHFLVKQQCLPPYTTAAVPRQ